MTPAAGARAADTAAARAAAEAVARTSYGKLVAWLAARTHDVAAAEDALSAAFAAALASWPRSGRPANPEAWLVTVARRRLVDQARRRRVSTAAEPALRLLAEGFALGPDASRLPDQRLGLLFACAHPALDPAVHAPLMLQVVLGLDAVRIASAFLTSPAAMAKRLVRAKTKIREAGIPFAVPDRDELAPRLGPVLEAIYAVFTDGWSDPTAADGRGGLTGEAIYLARLVAELLPVEPEAAGLLALLLHAEARRSARRDAAGAYVPLVLQNPADWDEALGAEAEALLHRASAFGRIGRFQLEAALQSAHVDGRRSGRPDWPAILRLYDALLALVPSPVVAMNRAVALAAVEGPAAGLAALDGCGAEGRLESYQPYWAARADLLARCRRDEEARSAYARAIGLEPDPAVRAFLLARQAETAR